MILNAITSLHISTNDAKSKVGSDTYLRYLRVTGSLEFIFIRSLTEYINSVKRLNIYVVKQLKQHSLQNSVTQNAMQF